MRVVAESELPDVLQVYDQAAAFAHEVGYIDWPSPFPEALCREMIALGELYCSDREGSVAGVMRVSRQPDPRIWGDGSGGGLYLAKIAVGNHGRDQRVFETAMLPFARSMARGSEPVRLDYLAGNDKLGNFYSSLGFRACGNMTFFSDKQQTNITVTKMQLPTP